MEAAPRPTPGCAPVARAHTIVLLALMLAGGALLAWRFESAPVGSYNDDAYYAVLAESIATGRGYRLVNAPAPQTDGTFPPGWPLLLTPVAALAPGNYTAMKLLSVALWFGALVLLWLFFARRLPPAHLAMLVALVAVHPNMLAHGRMVMSETAYLFFSLLTLVLFDAWLARPGGGRRHALLLGAVIASAFYTQLVRTVGLSMLLTLVAALLLVRRFRAAGFAAALFIAGMLLQSLFFARGGGGAVPAGYHAQVFSGSPWEKVGHVWHNAAAYIGDGLLANALVPFLGNGGRRAAVRIAVNTVLLLLVVLGAAVSPKSARPVNLYLGFYLAGILLFWNPQVGSSQARFLLPVVPFLYHNLIVACVWIGGRVFGHGRACSAAVMTCLALLLASSVARNVHFRLHPFPHNVPDITIGTGWIAVNAPADSVLMSRNPVPDYLYARRTTVGYPPPGTDIGEYIAANRVNYVLVSPRLAMNQAGRLDEYTESSLRPWIESRRDRFGMVYTNDRHNVTVYAVDGGAAPRWHGLTGGAAAPTPRDEPTTAAPSPGATGSNGA